MFALSKARSIADKILGQLQPYCEVILIAGSIRREKMEVKDIEIVCVPKRVLKGGMDLFGEDTRTTVIHPDFTRTVQGLGEILKGRTDGRMMKIKLKEKIELDLFMPQPIDFWRQFAIRTGSSDYSAKVIAAAWVKNGWCGTSDGLRLQKECEPTIKDGKTTWKCVADKPTLPPVWESEKEFFQWLGVTYVHPKMRVI
jgi:DNA polymerase/3'-5' exonuclease PolX